MSAALTPEMTVTSPSDTGRSVAVILLAFSADPIVRWTYPDPERFLSSFPALVRAFGGRAFAEGTALHIGAFLGAALWLPPGIGPDEDTLEALLQDSVAADRQPEVLGLMEQMGEHHPREPHWYLPLIGVDPAHQRKGYGAALLAQALARCDRDRVPAYLESTNPANVPLYQRHGFDLLGTIQAGSSPPLFPMLRPAR